MPNGPAVLEHIPVAEAAGPVFVHLAGEKRQRKDRDLI